MKNIHLAAALALAIAFQHSCHVSAQDAATVKPKSFAGVVADLKVQTHEIAVTLDDGTTSLVKVSHDTDFVRVPVGDHDLKNATPMSPFDIVKGDHVLISYAEGMPEARRVVVMTAASVATRNDAERADWDARGVAGVVIAKSDGAITLSGPSKVALIVTPHTQFRRYEPDSVTFTHAAKSDLATLGVGDQVRARGVKSSDGSSVAAEEIVFGTFWTKAGTITAIDPHTHEMTIREVGTKSPLVVKFAAETKLKALPKMDMDEMKAAQNGHAAPAGAGNAGNDHANGGPPAGFDLAKILANLPAGTLDNLKVGGAVVVTSTAGSQPGRITAIMVLANAEMFVQLMQQQSEGNGAGMAELMRSHGMNPTQGFSLPAILQ